MRPKTLLLLLLTLATLPLAAQEPDDRYWQFHAAIGWPAAIGSTQSSANGLMHTMFGAIRRVNPWLGIRFDGEYDAFNPSDKILKGYGAKEGRAQVYSLSADLQLKMTDLGWGHLYAMGGVGTHYKHAFIQNPSTGVICDPFWGICYGVGTDVITDTKTDTGYGANAGIGYEMPLTSDSQLFFEMKYQWINTKNGGAQFIPLSIGARF